MDANLRIVGYPTIRNFSWDIMDICQRISQSKSYPEEINQDKSFQNPDGRLSPAPVARLQAPGAGAAAAIELTAASESRGPGPLSDWYWPPGVLPA